MMQPEEVLLEVFENEGIQAWSTLDGIDSSNEFILMVRNETTVEHNATGLGWREFTYNMDLQCYKKGSQADAYSFADRVLLILDSMYDKCEVDLGIHSVGWLPPLNDKSGTSLGIQLTITQGE